MLLALAWKNIWRNKVRSIVVILAITFGLIGGVLSVGIMQGWIAQRVDDAIHNEVSHIQIHESKYLENDELGYIVSDFETIADSLDKNQKIKSWTSRVKTTVMLQSSWASTGLSLVGIEPKKERLVSGIKDCLIAGDYVEEGKSIPEILISKKTAEALKLRNYTLTKDKKENLLACEVPQAVFEKLLPLEGMRYRTERDFRSALKDLITEEELKLYEQSIFKTFEFYRLRSKVNMTTQSVSGDIAYATFRVIGIYKTSNSGFDGMSAYVDKQSLTRILGLQGNAVHEIAIVLEDPEQLESVAQSLQNISEKITVHKWTELRPDLAMSTDFVEVMYLFYIGIILFALAFGIVNTMLMAVLERIREIGMLMAVGMNKGRIFRMIMLETLVLSLSGAVLGIIFGYGIVEFFADKGIDFGMWAEGFEAMGYSAFVYPIVTGKVYIGIAIMVFVTGIIASIWPARRALKLNPAEAVRSDF